MAKRSKRIKIDELPGLADPKAPIDGAVFLKASQPLLVLLEKDLAERAESPAVTAALKAQHAADVERGRTADGYPAWCDGVVTQVAAAWLLSCVFVRVLEDRGLLAGSSRIAGPGAEDSQRQFFELAPSLTERDYLLVVFRELSRLPGLEGVFSAKSNPVWKLTPSAEAARALLALFRRPSAAEPAFRFGQADTRFLGDLYQDLSEAVRKKYALLQTPDFIESFILDRTLERAIERFGLDHTDLIDPTCGSGHFLLGAFERLFEHRLRSQPGLDIREAARLALDKVYGADINPYAVAIARFRLTLAFIDKAGYQTLADVPELPLHVVVADSLLHNKDVKSQTDFKDLEGQTTGTWTTSDIWALENEAVARDVLHRDYAAVVGNPPYITVKDKVLRDKYREMYSAAGGKYSLAAPFCQRFFQLGKARGFTGQITANSFMKREFGKKLITEVLPTFNLDIIVNTSGAYIPGHGTPTVLLFGTAEEPQDGQVLSVLAKRGEPSTPAEPENGEVWASIAKHWNELEFENDYISVANTERDKLSEHPWSLAGGGATELKALLEERAETTLGDHVTSIGFMAITGEDDVFARPRSAWARAGAEPEWIFDFGVGEGIRDWGISCDLAVAFPYKDASLREPREYPKLDRLLWPYKTTLLNRPTFGGKKYRDAGRTYYEYHQVPLERLRVPLSIAFAFVATHNHFVLDRGGKVFNRSAPIIKLPESATEDDHLALLAYLNSSTACFWMKQVYYPKASASSDISTVKGRPEANRYEFAGTGMQSLPIPRITNDMRRQMVALGREAHNLAVQLAAEDGVRVLALVCDQGLSIEEALTQVSQKRSVLGDQLATIQEDIDWLVYRCFDLVESWTVTDARQPADKRPFLGDPAAEWKERHSWLAESRELQTIETAVYKRLWEGRRGVFGHSAKSLDDEVSDAVQQHLEEQVEATLSKASEVRSRSELATALPESLVGVIASELTDTESAAVVPSALDRSDSVPYLTTLILKPTALKKHEAWVDVWRSQRQGNGRPAKVPPKFKSSDFQTQSFWRMRGKLNVPKERFISYPGCESDEDGEPVYGWAGWDHLQRAQALATLYQKRKTEEAWSTERLIPMLAGLYELLPWLKQWHNDKPDPVYGEKMGDFYERFIEGERNAHGLSKDDITGWRPPAKSKRKAKKQRPKKPAAKKLSNKRKSAKSEKTDKETNP